MYPSIHMKPDGGRWSPLEKWAAATTIVGKPSHQPDIPVLQPFIYTIIS